jgi:hypothetical protein
LRSSTRRLLALAAVALSAASCVDKERRFELVAGSGDLGGALVYRLDQATGEVCAFRPYSEQQKDQVGLPRTVIAGFKLVGCAGELSSIESAKRLDKGRDLISEMLDETKRPEPNA